MDVAVPLSRAGACEPSRCHAERFARDGDFFREGYKRREINARHLDCFVDLDGDGDIDILTGQGHGGSRLRFCERDYVIDCLNKTLPRVKVGACENRP